jgi:cobalamin synthase
MSIVGITWYLSGLFFVATVLGSAMTVVPEVENFHAAIMLSVLVLAVASAAGAYLMTRHRRKHPNSRLFQSRAAARVATGIAIMLTVAVLLVVVG